MPAAALPFGYTDFSGGVNTKDATYLLTDNQARDMLNVQSTRTGAIVKRNGLVTFSTPPDALTSLFAFEAGGPFLIGAGGTSLYSIGTGGAVTLRKGGLTNNARWCWAQQPQVAGQGPLYGMNGVDTPQQWDGIGASMSAWTAVTGVVPNGTICFVHNNSVFVAGVPAFPSRLFWSEPGDPTNWPVANVVDLDPMDGDVITGLGPVGPYLLVGKNHKLFVVTNSDTGANRRLSDTVGIAAHRSIAAGPLGTYFLSDERGVYMTNGSTLTVLSDLIQPTIDAIVAAEKKFACGAFYQGHYYLAVCDNGTANNKTLDWDSTLGSWWLQSVSSNEFALWHPSPAGQLFSAKATAAIVDECFAPGVFTDNGQPITWVWRGPWQSPSFYRRRRFPTPYFRKRLRQMRVQGHGSVDISIARDFALAETLYQAAVFAITHTVFGGSDSFGGGGVYGDTAILQEARLYSFGVAYAFSVVFGGVSTTDDAIETYVLMLIDRTDGQVG
jgi:hypothetical protein